MMTPTKLTLAIFVIVQLLPSAVRTARANDFPSQTLTPTVAEVGWTTVKLTDLVKNSASDCIVESHRLVRCAGRLRIAALTKTSVHGDGVEIQFTDSRIGKGGIELDHASEVVVSNFHISWLGGGARDPIVPGAQRIQSFGNVAACANHAVGGVLSLDLPLEGTQQMGSASVWDDAKGWPWYPSAPAAFEVDFPTGATAAFTAGRSDCLPLLAGLVGHRILMRHIVCSNHAFHCLGCQNVTVKLVHVISAPGMGFVFEGGGSNIALVRDVIAPRCAPGCALPEPSTTADAAHFADVAGNILLERNDFGWQGDDAVNITGLLAPASVAPDAETAGAWLNVKPAWRNRLYSMTVGSTVSLYDTGLTALGEARILAVEPAVGTIELSSLPADTTNFIISRTAGIPKNIVIRNNFIHDNRARGILMGGSNALIENNVIERVTMEAILVPADTGPWYEGPGAQHVTIAANTISDVNRFPARNIYPSAISVGLSMAPGYVGALGTPIQDLIIEGNSFSNVFTNGVNPIFIGHGVSAVQVEGNR